MTRPTVAVREATGDDLPQLFDMWVELRDLASRIERVAPGPDKESVLERLQAVTDDPDARAVVATVDDEVAGMTVLTCAPYAPLFDQRAVHAHYLHVRDGFRRRGVGKALLGAAVTFADEVGAEHVVTSVLPQLREAQRFYARLGFGPLVVRRAAPLGVLRRRLAMSGQQVAGSMPNTVPSRLLARRRSLRRIRARVARVTD